MVHTPSHSTVRWMSKSMAMMSMMKKRKETRRNQRILEIFQVNVPPIYLQCMIRLSLAVLFIGYKYRDK